jgi:hypothetical protein
MTVDLSLIGEHLRRLDEYLKILHKIAQLSYEESINDPIRIGSTETLGFPIPPRIVFTIQASVLSVQYSPST